MFVYSGVVIIGASWFRKSVSWVFDAKQDFLIPLPKEEVINTLVKTGVESLYCQPKEGTKANGPLQNDHQAWPTPNGSHLMIPVILSNVLITLKMPTGRPATEISRRDVRWMAPSPRCSSQQPRFFQVQCPYSQWCSPCKPAWSCVDGETRHDFGTIFCSGFTKGVFWQNVRWFRSDAYA